MSNVPDNVIPKRLNSNKKISEMRAMLREHAESIFEQYLQTAIDAKEAGEFETAKDIFQWLLEHMPADQISGERMVDSSIDKGTKNDRGQGPRIQIGVAIGQNPIKALPQVTVVESDDNES